MIKKLSPDLINKIAAGEVVERPASVVKELVENAIDAQADQINLALEQGGNKTIVILDNGIGMSKEDALLAIERHATSKISSFDDLFKIQTLGFRGEALASISSVSQFTLETKTKDSAEGTRLEIRNSKLEINPCGTPEGTKITIKDLFYNVPARQKFLKAPATEYNYILELFTNFALINPQIGFNLKHNDKLIFNLPKTDKWLERCKQVLGSDIANHLIPVNIKGNISISGFIGKPDIARNNRKSQYIFVNNRAVNDFIIAKAAKEGFGTLISRELQPTFILNIDVDPQVVDVNVHPRKTEVKFNNSQEIFRNVLGATQKALSEADLTQQISPGLGTSIKRYTLKPQTGANYRPNVSHQSNFKNIYNKPSQVSQALEFSKQILKNDFEETNTANNLGDWKLLGQIHNSYLLIESGQGIMIIDQHAAAERILYEKYKKQYKTEKVKSQRLLIPLNLELSATEVQTLNQSLNFLQGIGFDIEVFGNNAFIINAVPQEVSGQDVKQTILGVINDLQDNDFKQAKSLEDKKDLVIKYAACRSAVKFKDKLESKEQIKLLEDIIDIIDQINTCPHGRPFLMELTLDQLAKNFKRK